MKKTEPWITVGISGEAAVLGLWYDPHSETIVAHLEKRHSGSRPLKCLYVRHRNQQQYQLLMPASDVLSYDDVVLSPLSSCLFVNVFQVVHEGDQGTSFDWHGLQAIELPSGKKLFELKGGDLEPRFGHRSPWVAGIVGLAADAKTLFVSLAIPQQSDTKLNYSLVKLDPVERRYELITELSKVFL